MGDNTEHDDADDESERDFAMKSSRGPGSRCLHISRHVCQWVWGCTDDPCPSDVQCCCGCLRKRIESPPPPASRAATPNFTPVSLRQTRSEKIGLFIGLVIIVSIAISLFIFFSLFFGQITRGPLRLVGTTNSTAVLQAADKLRSYGMIATWFTHCLCLVTIIMVLANYFFLILCECCTPSCFMFTITSLSLSPGNFLLSSVFASLSTLNCLNQADQNGYSNGLIRKHIELIGNSILRCSPERILKFLPLGLRYWEWGKSVIVKACV